MENDNVFEHCFQYFIEDMVTDEMAEAIRNAEKYGIDERTVMAQYMASWIPWEEHADKLCARICNWVGY